MSNDETANEPIDTVPSRSAAHATDAVGFFFGVVFLVCAAVAIAVRSMPLGTSSGEAVTVTAAAVLLFAGVFGVIGSLRNRNARRT